MRHAAITWNVEWQNLIYILSGASPLGKFHIPHNNLFHDNKTKSLKHVYFELLTQKESVKHKAKLSLKLSIFIKFQLIIINSFSYYFYIQFTGLLFDILGDVEGLLNLCKYLKLHRFLAPVEPYKTILLNHENVSWTQSQVELLSSTMLLHSFILADLFSSTFTHRALPNRKITEELSVTSYQILQWAKNRKWRILQ